MLNKSAFIAIGSLQPKTLHQAAVVKELLETVVCYQIQKKLSEKAYEHLNVSFNYDPYRADLSVTNYLHPETLTDVEEYQIRLINNIINKTVDDAIEEYHLYQKYAPCTALNFNCCLVNSNNFILTMDVYSTEG